MDILHNRVFKEKWNVSNDWNGKDNPSFRWKIVVAYRLPKHPYYMGREVPNISYYLRVKTGVDVLKHLIFANNVNLTLTLTPTLTLS